MVNNRNETNEKFINEVESYFNKNRDIFGDYVELTRINKNVEKDLANSIEIMIRGVNFSAFIVQLGTTDIKNMMTESIEVGLTTAILDELVNFDAEDDFYMNTYSSLDEYWSEFEEEELLDMILEDEEVFSSLISELGRKYD